MYKNVQYSYICRKLIFNNHIGGVLVRVLYSSVADRGSQLLR